MNGRFSLRVRLIRIIAVMGLTLATSLSVLGQHRGTLKGTVRTSAGPPAPGVTVDATNQVTRRVHRAHSGPDGRYTFQLLPGAYRISAEPPAVAKFEKDNKGYGEFALARGDTLENVIIEAGKESTIDIQLEEKKAEPIKEVSTGEPTGFGGRKSVASAPQTTPDRRETRDRWRIGFPEYDRYGDRGARGRDIPFKKGHWWDPYNQSVLKGDYPVKGNKTFLILSASPTDVPPYFWTIRAMAQSSWNQE